MKGKNEVAVVAIIHSKFGGDRFGGFAPRGSRIFQVFLYWIWLRFNDQCTQL